MANRRGNRFINDFVAKKQSSVGSQGGQQNQAEIDHLRVSTVKETGENDGKYVEIPLANNESDAEESESQADFY